MAGCLMPLYLLADSRLLFPQNQYNLFPEYLLQSSSRRPGHAAYIGACNGDEPAFYNIFKSAMQLAGISNTVQIFSEFSRQDQKNLAQSDLILLAGGSPIQGWDVLKKKKITKVLIQKYYDGAILVGVSAGAALLGMMAYEKDKSWTALQIVPYIIAVHEENDSWNAIEQLLLAESRSLTALGIPFGGGMIYHPDQTLEAIAKPVQELKVKNGQIAQTIILPN